MVRELLLIALTIIGSVASWELRSKQPAIGILIFVIMVVTVVYLATIWHIDLQAV